MNRAQPLCRQFDPDTWFPTGNSGPALQEAEKAKSICRQCPIRMECLEHALVTRAEFGIWGGYDERERRLMMRQIPQSASRRSNDVNYRNRTALVRALGS